VGEWGERDGAREEARERRVARGRGKTSSGKASVFSFQINFPTHLRAHPRLVERRVVPVEGSPGASLARLGQKAAGERGRSCSRESLVLLLMVQRHHRHHRRLLLRLLLVVVPSGAASRYTWASHGVHSRCRQSQKGMRGSLQQQRTDSFCFEKKNEKTENEGEKNTFLASTPNGNSHASFSLSRSSSSLLLLPLSIPSFAASHSADTRPRRSLTVWKQQTGTQDAGNSVFFPPSTCRRLCRFFSFFLFLLGRRLLCRRLFQQTSSVAPAAALPRAPRARGARVRSKGRRK
jgi:hypothetical protein